jgi:superfamily II DNA or RNA helicase
MEKSPDILNLINHVNLYNDLPKTFKTRVFQSWPIYDDYCGIDDLFNKLNETKIITIIGHIKTHLDDNTPRNTILQKLDRYHLLVKFILDYYKDLNLDPKNQKIEFINNTVIPFVWRDNQIKGWQAAIDCDFVSGIHSQATGSGKSLIALKSIWEYHKKYPKNHILWICERKDIPQKLFFVGHNKKGGLKHTKNYNFWKEHDIINMHNFEIIEHIYNKDRNWTQTINNYQGNKPIFLIINRAFMTTRSKQADYNYRYEEIIKMPQFVIIDECHSSMANETYQLLLYLKFNRDVKIHGLSATPYRSGKSKTDIILDIDCDELVNIETTENEEKLLRVFSKPSNCNQLNLLSFFNLKDAIEAGVILEPIFHWYYIDKKNEEYEFSINDAHSVLSVLDTIIGKCKYRKCIVWCGTIDFANFWYKIFKNHNNKYNNLSNIKQYIDHSKIKNNDYDNFYDAKDNSILFCANKFREGSDIPYLTCCMFLDEVSNRGSIPFIQCIGRVLRRDTENLKINGHVLDGCVKDSDTTKMKSIINKILRYYLHLYEISKSDFEFNDQDVKISEKKIDQYNQICQSIDVAPKKKKIIINLKNDKKMTIDVTKIDLSTVEWNAIIPKFNKALKKMIIMSDHEEYIALQKYCIEIEIQDKYDYDKRYKLFRNFYWIDQNGDKIKLDPKERFPIYFKSWYDFLKIDTSAFIESLDDWREHCNQYKIKSLKDYQKICQANEAIPSMPDEFYHEFTNLNNELKLLKSISRR